MNYLLKRLKLFHKFSVNRVLDPECKPSPEENPPFVKNPRAIAKVEYRQVLAAGRKRYQRSLFLQGCHQVVKKNRVLADGIYADFVQWFVFKINTIATPENIAVIRTLKVLIDPQAAVRGRWQCRIL